MWVDDREASACHHCTRQFSLLLRRHHCRRCGQIFCHACSRNRVLNVEGGEDKQMHRLCDSCMDRLELNGRIIVIPQHSDGCVATGGGWRKVAAVISRSGSPIVMNQQTVCPVCNVELSVRVAEGHLKKCLEGRHCVVGNRYTVVHWEQIKECDICYEEMGQDQPIALLNCLCQFHQHCIDQWFALGHACPIHPQ